MIAYSRRQDSNNSYRSCLASRVSPALRDRRIDKKIIAELELSASQRWPVYTAAGVSAHDESGIISVRTENGSRGIKPRLPISCYRRPSETASQTSRITCARAATHSASFSDLRRSGC